MEREFHGGKAAIARRPLTPLIFAGIALGYCLAGCLSRLLAVPPGYAAPIWPAAGIALAAVLIFGSRVWPAIWLGSFAANLWIALHSGDELRAMGAAVFIASGACLQAIGSAWLLRRARVWPDAFRSSATITRLLVLGGPIGCVTNAHIGVASLLALGLIEPGEFGFNWLSWWVGDAIGVVLVTPPLLVLSGAMGVFWRRRAARLTLPVAVALSIVIALFLFASAREQARIESELENAALGAEVAIASKMSALIATLEGVQSFYEGSEHVDAEEFRAFTRRSLEGNPDLLALSWNPRIPHAERPQHEKRRGPHGAPLRFVERDADGELVPAGVRDEYVIVEYIEPLSANRRVIGFDVASDSNRRAALSRARDQGVPTATSQLQLLQAERSRPGLLVFAPIYRTEDVPPTVERRRAELAGFAVAVILVEELLATAVTGLPAEPVELRLVETDPRDGSERLIAATGELSDEATLLVVGDPLRFADRSWRLDVAAGAEYVAVHRAPGLVMVLVIGLSLSGLLGAFTLILASHECQHAIEASQDTLTGLVNRREFDRRLKNALSSCHQHGARHSLAYCDLDRFKLVNDTAGHLAGDELLRQIAGILHSAIRQRDTVARLGGDEFGLLLENCPIEKAAQIASNISTEIQGFRFPWDERQHSVGVSIGLTELTAEVADVTEVMTRADRACYTAKDLGRNRVHVDRADSPLANRRQTELRWVSEIRETLENDRFMVYQQAIHNLVVGRDTPMAFEVLLRQRGDGGEPLPPGGAIAVAERYGAMTEVDRWVIREAVTRAAKPAWKSAVLSINLSANSLDDPKLGDYIQAEVERTAVAPERLCFEITETTAVAHLDSVASFMRNMKGRGYRFALDDFGAGISSFRYLRNLPVDWLKIDGNLVQGITEDRTAYVMVSAIQQIADTMGITTIAEWVSDESMLCPLREIGVGAVQGFAFGYPEPLDSLSPAA